MNVKLLANCLIIVLKYKHKRKNKISENVPYNRDNYLHRGELFVIEDDLADGWVEDWAGAGVAEIEDLLAKHNHFLTYLAEREEANSDESTLATTADKKFSDQLTD